MFVYLNSFRWKPDWMKVLFLNFMVTGRTDFGNEDYLGMWCTYVHIPFSDDTRVFGFFVQNMKFT